MSNAIREETLEAHRLCPLPLQQEAAMEKQAGGPTETSWERGREDLAVYPHSSWLTVMLDIL